MNNMLLKGICVSLLLLPALASAMLPVPDKADNAFMLFCTVLVLFMVMPGIALFYGGLLRSKNVLSLLTQVAVSSSLVCIIWFLYGYSLIFSKGNAFFGSFEQAMLRTITPAAQQESLWQYVHVVFQLAFACITVALIVGSVAERMRFSAVLIFVVFWLTLAYVPVAHMIWADGLLAQDGALDFAGGTVVHINAAVAGLVAAGRLGKRTGYGKESFKPHNLPMVFSGTAILYIGWFGFNAGSAAGVNEITVLAFLNTVMAGAAAVVSWAGGEWVMRSRPSLLGASSGFIAGLVAITPACGYVAPAGALIIGLVGGFCGLWGVTVLKKWLAVDDPCDVFAIHGVCAIVGCLLTGIFTSSVLGGVGYAQGVTMWQQIGIQLFSIIVTLLWSAVVAFVGLFLADKLVGLRVKEEQEREGLDVSSHGESAYN